MIYLLLGLYLFVLMVKYDINKQTRRKNFHLYLAYILMVCLMVFRYRVGGDTLNYMTHFEQLPSELYALDLYSNQRWQPIPSIVFYLCKIWADDFTYVQAIFAVFVNTVIFSFFKKYTRFYFTAIFLYALAFYMRLNCEIMRESLAVSFFLIAYPYMMKEKYIKYYLFSFLAFMCHSSAVFIFILPLFLSQKHNKRFIYLLILFIAVAFYTISNSSLMGAITNYANLYVEYQSSVFGKLFTILFSIILPSYFLYAYRKRVSFFIRFAMFVYIGCSIVSLFFYIAFRFNNYLMPFYLLLMADYLNDYSVNNFSRRPLKYSVAMIVFLFSFMMPYFSDVSKAVGHPARWYCCWYPYYSIFDKQEDFDRETFITFQNTNK